MSDAQAERAIQQLYEDTSARDELTDGEANVLLAWGEAQIKTLAARGLDDAAFDEAFSHLRGVMKNINRYTGGRSYKSVDELNALLNELAADAQAMGVNVQAEQLAVPQAQAADDNIALIQAMTAMLTPTVSQTAPEQSSITSTPETDSNDEPPDDKPGFWDKLEKKF